MQHWSQYWIPTGVTIRANVGEEGKIRKWRHSWKWDVWLKTKELTQVQMATVHLLQQTLYDLEEWPPANVYVSEYCIFHNNISADLWFSWFSLFQLKPKGRYYEEVCPFSSFIGRKILNDGKLEQKIAFLVLVFNNQ